ncbi:hypothetical protein C1646_759990 [Rhizophagus diaphanus]|nr:hypothetical protein C1646_759990 [Rhizophagus diaphanus] [Rhizophagus sp. MUCL 43196]
MDGTRISSQCRNIIKQGSIIRKECGVKYYKIVPADIESCPYIIIVSKGIHTHPPPPPNHVPSAIRSRLQELIYQANTDTMDIAPRIVTGNLIKTYFGIDYLADVHASLNNAARLRYFVNKIQKEINPQGYGLLGVVYHYSRNIDNFCDYVKRLGRIFEDIHIMIICTTSEQLFEWKKCEYFEIYLYFKRVAGEIKEFEIIYYNNEHNLSNPYLCSYFTNSATTIAYQRIFQSIFDLVLELTGSPIQFKHIDGTGWGCIIVDLDFAQAKGLGLALSKIYLTKDWEEHFTHILKSCQMHYKRKIQEKRYGET